MTAASGISYCITLDEGNVPGHESLHFAGLQDTYIPGPVVTVTNGATDSSFSYQIGFVVPGTENDIMANPFSVNSQLTQQEVDQLGQAAVGLQQTATPEREPGIIRRLNVESKCFGCYRVTFFLVMVIVIGPFGISAFAQVCSDFILSARTSTRSISRTNPLSFEITLSNRSDQAVTLVSRELPTTWAIYEYQAGSWVPLASGGLVRGVAALALPEQNKPTVPDLFPPEEYKTVRPGGSWRTRYDLSEELWRAFSKIEKEPNVRVRVAFGYKYSPSAAEEQFNMLKCSLKTAPTELDVDLRNRPNLH